MTSPPGQGDDGDPIPPARQRPVTAAEPPATAPPPSVQLNDRVRVLLVEDNPDVAEVARLLLEELDYDVVHAADVAAAREALARASIDVALTDIMVPGGADGIDLARELRQRGSLPVVLAAGYSDQAQAAANEGFAILRKPYSMSSVNDALREALGAAAKAKVAS